MTLSLCMIVQNEEAYLAQCLASVQGLVDEIIIVDGGSKDKTKTIARQFTDKVFDFPWCDNFSTSRNFSLTKATGDWILVLDADEIIAHSDHVAIKKLLSAPPSVVAYSLTQVSYTNDGTYLGYTPLQKKTPESKDFSGFISCNRIVLFRNHLHIQYEGAVHESVRTSCERVGKIVHAPLSIHHYQFEKGLAVQKEKQIHYLHIYENNIDTFANKEKAYRDIASIYFSFKKDYTTALHYFTKAFALNTKNITTFIGMSLCYYHLHDLATAQKIVAEGLILFPNNTHLLSLLKTFHEPL